MANPGVGEYNLYSAKEHQWVKKVNQKGTWSINPSTKKIVSDKVAPSIPSH
jgi:hypothetical protein